MITLATTFVIAAMIGVIIGLLPGFGMLNTMIICWVFLAKLDTVNLLVFYVVVASISQFVGSVIATTTGIPGETSSIPASIEGPRLFEKNQGVDAIAMAAIGSFVGTAVVGTLLLIALPYIATLAVGYYSNTFQTAIFLGVTLLILFSSSNPFYINVLLMSIGIGLALVGSDLLTGGGIVRINFGIDSLKQGVPLEIVAITLIAIPQVLKHVVNLKYDSIQKIPSLGLVEGLKKFTIYAGAGARGTFIGLISGMVPGAAYTFSSMLAYQLEKFLRIRKQIYSKTGDMHSLVSAETANNAGVLISMVPVFLFGLPIMGSEALLLNLIQMSGTAVGFNVLSAREYFLPTVICFLLSGIIGVVVSWQWSNQILKLFKIPSNILRPMLLLMLIASALYVGYGSYDFIYYSVLLLIMIPFGIMLKKYDTSIIIFSFLIFPELEGSMIRFVSLHF